MSIKRRGLGRGFEALVGAGESDLAQAGKDQDNLCLLPIERISSSPFQPRKHFEPEALQELADSIRAQGILQPVVVRSVGGDYELIAGERRWRAAQLAELTEIPAVIKEMSDDTVAAVALIENIQREDLSSLEQASAIQRLISEFELTHQQAAEAIGRSRVSVSNLLRLLELPDPIKQLLDQGDLDMGHARALLAAPYDKQIKIAQQVVARGLSVRETEKLARESQSPQKAQKTSNNPDPNILHLERELSEQLGAQVNIQEGKAGVGKLVINYKSADELEGILRRLR